MKVEESQASYGLKPPFISKIRLKGYKSIKDAEIEFKQGLNIIIGPNGSGKTNLLDFLVDLGEIGKIKTPHYCDVNFHDWDNKKWSYAKEAKQLISSTSSNKPFQRIRESLKKDNKTIVDNHEYDLNEETKIDYSLDIKRIFKFVKINFDLPKNIIGLNEAYNINLKYKQDSEFYHLDGTLSKSLLDEEIASKISNTIIFVLEDHLKITKKDLIDKDLFLNSPFYGDIIDSLNKFTPIKSFKIDEDVSVKTKSENEETSIDIKYLRFSFFVDNEWVSWDMLSDGTKRLFYIIFLLSSNDSSKKYLIEEPELGIHPHQLYLLMTFLKEKSEDNQIIITTHSPQVLNILDEKELGRIIITKNEKKKGTTLRNLTKRELKKAKSFMEEDGLSLSDYWIHSDLEEQTL